MTERADPENRPARFRLFFYLELQVLHQLHGALQGVRPGLELQGQGRGLPGGHGEALAVFVQPADPHHRLRAEHRQLEAEHVLLLGDVGHPRLPRRRPQKGHVQQGQHRLGSSP